VFLAVTGRSFAGGSGLNVVVVVNQNSTNSIQLGNYYCEKRGVPPLNLVRISWNYTGHDWTRAQLLTNLVVPLNNAIAARGLTNQVDYVVLSMDIPYRAFDPDGSANTATSVLFYGFKNDTAVPPGFPPSCSLPPSSTSGYAGSEDIFRNISPGSFKTNYLAVMLTSETLTQAKALVDRGMSSDGTWPTQTVFLAKSADLARNIRYWTFDNAIFDTRLRGNYSMLRTNTGALLGLTGLLGYENGLEWFAVSSNAFVPGAIADSLTSYGGIILNPANSQSNLLNFIRGGAIGSYGTVIEPCTYLEKFPSASIYFCQARGFNVAECYYQSVTNPYQGLIVAEPLAAPFALPAAGSWSNLPPVAQLVGTTNLSLSFSAADPQRPVQQVDLFLDGKFLQTLTNIPPRQNNILYVTLPGKTNLSFTVPLNATIKSVAAGLAAVLNSVPNQPTTKVTASTHGDRLQLSSTDPVRTGSQTYVALSNHIGTASSLTTFITAARTIFLDTIAYGLRSFNVSGTLVPGDILILSVTLTNGTPVSVSLTNSAPSGSVGSFVQQLLALINATPALQGADGLVAEDFEAFNPNSPNFNLRARGIGLDAAQIQVSLTGTFGITPAATVKLDENLGDLQPRNHLYLTAGTTNLPLTFAFNTSTNADGWHELTAVAYEGSHVRTQKRLSQTIRIQNTPLSAAFTSLMGGSNTALSATLQFSVVANTNDASINRIELFSTGGPWGVVSNLATANFSLAATNLHLGLHPFYALVTRADGKQYRTETKWIRIVDAEPPFHLQFVSPVPTPTLAWSATAGRRYEIHSSTNVAAPFTLHDAVVPTNSSAIWVETNPPPPRRFYRALAIP
jgi:uncharacterized protein (TIGR03790 family)